MKKQVPESSKQNKDRNQQLAELQDKLRGNKIFRKFRGEHNYDIVETLDRILGRSDTPSEFIREWDVMSGDLRILGNLMATLKRDGKTDAFEALRNALINPTYTFPGETIPIEKTVSVTLVMFEPEKTLSMLQWLVQGYWKQLYNNESLLAVTMLRNFPSLRRAMETTRSRYHGWELGYAYQIDVLRKVSVPKDFRPLHIGAGQYDDEMEIAPPFSSISINVESDAAEEIECLCHFAFWVTADQGEVLSRFNREDQSHIATWQFHVHPTELDERIGWIGLHPEAEHADYQHKYAYRSSAGVSQSLGAIINPPDKDGHCFRMDGDYARQGDYILLSDVSIR
jgi:hypothetical protein